MAKLTKKEKTIFDSNDMPYTITNVKLTGDEIKWIGKVSPKQENLSASVGLLVLLIVFLLGNLLGHWVSNQLRESTWHSPKGCPLFVRQEK